VTHIRSYKTRLNCDAELIHFAQLVILNLINNAAESYIYIYIGIQTSMFLFLSRTDKQQVDSFIVKHWQVKLCAGT